jgi:lipid-A-disaccharide synthase-like uncharacterized protein
MYSRLTPTCLGKWLPSSGGRRLLTKLCHYEFNVCPSYKQYLRVLFTFLTVLWKYISLCGKKRFSWCRTWHSNSFYITKKQQTVICIHFWMVSLCRNYIISDSYLEDGHRIFETPAVQLTSARERLPENRTNIVVEPLLGLEIVHLNLFVCMQCKKHELSGRIM